MNPEFVVLIIDLAFSAIATFIGILLWSLTRDAPWMLVIIAVVVRFGEIVFRTLADLGIFLAGDILFLGIPLFWVSLRGAAWILIAVAFGMMVRRNRV